jgi:hypothetical protein
MSIRVGPEVTRIWIEDSEKICLKVPRRNLCKKFYSDIMLKFCKPEKITERGGVQDPGFDCSEEIDSSQTLPRRCKTINIYANATENEIKIILPVS